MYGKTLSKGFTQGFSKLRKFLFKRHISHRYKFHTIPPNQPMLYSYVPRQEWRQDKNQFNYVLATIYLGIFSVGFAFADFLYALAHDKKQMYRLYVQFPKICKAVDDLYENQQTKPWMELAGKIWVKDYVELRAFWQQFYDAVRGNRLKKIDKMRDQKAAQLKKEIQEMNRKHKMPGQQQKQSVF